MLVKFPSKHTRSALAQAQALNTKHTVQSRQHKVHTWFFFSFLLIFYFQFRIYFLGCRGGARIISTIFLKKKERKKRTVHWLMRNITANSHVYIMAIIISTSYPVLSFVCIVSSEVRLRMGNNWSYTIFFGICVQCRIQHVAMVWCWWFIWMF